MTDRIMESELILNTDGSIYHLNLLPEDIADTIILVGDPNRVKQVSKHFDHIELQKTKREFVTHTGLIGKKRLTVVGTGIGGGNIDITMNELDALVNVDLKNRIIKKEHRQLRFIRLGTSGALQKNTPVDSILISTFGLGLDGLLSYYKWENQVDEKALLKIAQDSFSELKAVQSMYVAAGAKELIELFHKNGIQFSGITLTCPGFYGAQNRQIRAPLTEHSVFTMARKIGYKNDIVTNLEMETAAIYGLARILDHRACSISAIIANRDAQTFSPNPEKTVADMIQTVLTILCEN
ncbi:MAG: phosphorylase [Gammaproteobacteria bacterium CG_4_10_14_0_8_um_filter_38_16]|nr:MAG: phosphorylase [Gammaproteobacteria bacterium CG_4_10_14_0_8_um_filter_38_16]PJA03946.1 MAG: phosphorylase [Gammaproteobacteria bacterium CG_4_10_14_0_2_um_filter_38_22]PJB09727.1 MAG: phosphorylase [Gammaproteobacteria bacterium CG_4_9_14_3_um_filter_38_9]